MLDYSKLGPGNTPAPSAPSTTAPVAPAAPGGLTTPAAPATAGSLAGLGVAPSSAAPSGAYPAGSVNPDGSYHEATQAEVDAMAPWDRAGHGLDSLGHALFGQGNGSVFGGAPVVGDLGRALGTVGQVAHNVGDWTLIKPVEAVATVASHVPLGWVPGGADDTFNQIGDQLKATNPSMYADWLLIKGNADKDVLGGGNLKADFNVEYMKMLDDQQHDSFLGGTPELALGRTGVGSLGGAFSAAVRGWLGLAANTAQGALGNAGAFNPDAALASFDQMRAKYEHPDAYTAAATPSDAALYAFKQMDAGTMTEAQARDYVAKAGSTKNNSRVEESARRLSEGGEVSDVEHKAIEAWQSGAWSLQHANDYIISHGQSITRNPIGQVLGSAITDPLTYATLGAGSVSKLGLTTGVKIAEMAGEGASLAQKLEVAASNTERLSVLAETIQSGAQTGPIFRVMRGMVDPLAVYKPSSVARAVTDLKNGVAVESFQRAYGHATLGDVRALAREFKVGPEVDSAIGSYAMDKADEMIAMVEQHSALNEGLGEELVHTHPDDIVPTLSQSAGRDAVTELTDHIQRVAKNTFTEEERANLAGRMSATFGNDPAYWEGRLSTMSHDMQSALHAVTYKRAEVGFEQARAVIDHGAYDGNLPIKDAVLMSPETLDHITAQAVIDNIEGALKNEAKLIDEPIAAATAEWNAMAQRYPAIANIGYAPGGKVQLEELVKELKKELERGAITKRALESELDHPALRPFRDFLDRNSVPGGERVVPPAELTARGKAALVDAEFALKQAGIGEVSGDKFFAAVRKAATVEKSNGRSVSETLYVYSKGEYKKMRLWLSADGKTGFAIKPDGDLVSVFNVGEKGAIQKVIPHLHALGATKLDAFDEAGRLPELYGAGGFKETSRVPWDPQYAPPGWKGGKPDVVYMEHPGAHTPNAAGDVVEQTPQPLWKVGFRPKEEVAWGLRRDANTGRYTIDRAPTISHNVDAVPFGRQRFSDTTRNVLGQIIGPSKAESLTKPVVSAEAFINTMRDGVTGQRLVRNIDQRFERSTFDAGIPKPMSKEIMRRAKEIAGLDYSTVRGIKPDNLWKSLAADNLIPVDFALKDGSTLNIHVIMDHLLQAAEGDFRVMGVTSKLSQAARNTLRKAGDGSNVSGQLTVGAYNKLRYAFNPMFVIQRITDGPYYSILYGVMPVGKFALNETNQALRAITENMGRTGLARHFSMDMPEYATRSNFTEGIRSGLQQAGLLGHRLDQIARAPDAIIANNMTNMLHARMGDIVKGALENLASVAEKGDPALKAEMLAAGDRFQTSFAAIGAHYNELAGRTLTDNEVGQQYVQDMLSGWRRQVVNADGTIDMSKLLHEGTWTTPNSIGEIASIHPDSLAQEVGAKYADAAALRRDVVGHVEKVGSTFSVVKGEHDLPWLEEQLTAKMHLHPDVVKRALAYFGDTWDGYWRGLARPVDEGGLDISAHYAKEAQDLIAMEARSRGMDPWEYLSGTMASNIGGKDLNTHMGQLLEFLKAGKAQQPLAEWTKVWRSHLDVSAQDTLMEEFEKATGTVSPHIEPAQFEYAVPKSAPGAAARPAVAKLPKSFKVEPGYAYRVEKPGAAAGGIPDHIGLTTGKPTSFYNRNEGEAIFRVKEADVPGQIGPGRHVGGEDRLTVGHIPPEKTEMLGADGQWHALEADPYDNFFGTNFPEMVKERITSGVPHPNPEVEGYMQQLSKWVNDNIGAELGSRTRSDLRDLVEKVPTAQATPYNRTHGLVVSLLKNKIQDAQQDVFRLAEMQTKRSVLERSLNHPLFGLYPSSYMWGKVLPESVKFIAKNPYAATYVINDVQRAIATQREYDTEFDAKMHSVDKSAGAFLADYLTPSLPWSDHAARTSPFVRDLLNGKDIGAMWKDELATMSPQRWVAQVINAMNEVPGAVDEVTGGNAAPTDPALQSLSGLGAPSSATPAPGGAPASGTDSSISGPTPAAALAPILADDLARLKALFVTTP